MKSITSIILAGGESKRMGKDKAFLNWKGKTFLRHILEKVSVFSDEIILSVNKNEEIYENQIKDIDVPVKIVKDLNPYSGPLNGIHSCSDFVEYNNVFISTCDTPDIKISAIEYLFENLKGYDGVIPVINGKFQPFNTFYKKEAVLKTSRLYEEGIRSIFRWIKTLNVRYIEDRDLRKYDSSLSTFTSINTPEEYKKFLAEK